MYNETVTTYTEDATDLSSPAFATQFSSPVQAFEVVDIKYFNWRFIMKNNILADPPISPKIPRTRLTQSKYTQFIIGEF